MKQTDNHILVIFGASGDLTERKLIPAIYNLYCRSFLPEKFAVLGVSRTKFTDEEYRKKVILENKHLKDNGSADKQAAFSEKIHYHAMETSDPNAYGSLKDRLTQLDISGNYIFYLSTPPSLYEVVSRSLSNVGLSNEEDGWKRIIIEKPFGYDLKTALELNKQLLSYFAEPQIYRIDHYLGKETVQNLLITRFANSIFEPLWNRNFIHHVEITAAETVGVEKRGGYYDGSGAMRDMIQNHLLQLAALVAMEPPVQATESAIRNERMKLFQSLRPLSPEDIEKNVIRGQYTSATIHGETVPGYREEEGVSPESRTETYVAMKFFIDNWRWSGVPFYIRTGKRMPTRVTEIVIHFNPTPHHLFVKNTGVMNQDNMLIIRIQPDEGMLLKFAMKIPGEGLRVTDVDMDFHYKDLADTYIPEAYERLLLDCIQGDATLYARGDAVEAAWQFIDPILKAWETNPNIKMYGYPAGTWGPENADDLVEGKHKNITWRYPCKNLSNDGIYCEL
ncbi:glucose-6-phosphate dehydrogenase [Cytophagaceae bacterium DM2B3-1]|uniref:Glucose-6-phosphate 1-dehydrogenase n=2 Tax=Xanthocytophaga TaxID=3078918 RepID=A0AAE3QUD3_9BACT|nr:MULTISPECIES: glucose-6-phosphate dehydrogenase [Xanthocytophaga]MDJ1483635.1 glucose-6-phosphate dehydrogenase [Xanthocytophaga flavus]MDJ1496865.1 glucose-6-phosphate dehydrogenase [Xanthocytophaga flavus]MDJ1505369.1 glucose-6-phosphate dehydrogenase [Xanthocytophaga agilis]